MHQLTVVHIVVTFPDRRKFVRIKSHRNLIKISARPLQRQRRRLRAAVEIGQIVFLPVVGVGIIPEQVKNRRPVKLLRRACLPAEIQKAGIIENQHRGAHETRLICRKCAVRPFLLRARTLLPDGSQSSGCRHLCA